MNKQEQKKPETEDELYRKHIVDFRYNIIIYFSIFLALAITIRNFVIIQLGNDQSTIGLVVAVLVLANAIVLYYTRKLVITASALLLILGVWMMVVLSTNLDNGQGLYWFYTFPILAYLTTGRRMAIFWMAAIIIGVLSALWLGNEGLIPFAYSTEVVGHFIVSVIVTFLLVYIYESINQRYYDILIKRKDELAEVTMEIEREVDVRIETENKIKSMLGALSEGIIATDKAGKITLINGSAEQYLHTTKEHLLGKNAHDAIKVYSVDGKVIPKSKRILSSVLTTGKEVEGSIITGNVVQFERLDEDKVKFPVALSAGPVRSHDGKHIIGAILAFRDVTTEFEINKAKSEFIYQASHQLKTPLTSINWYTEALQSKKSAGLEKWQKEYVEEIRQSSLRLTGLVKDLLEVSRIEMGSSKYKEESLNPIETIEGVIKSLKINAEVKKIKLVFKSDKFSAKPHVKFNQHFFQIVIENLINNAIHYSPDKTTVTTTVKKIDEGQTVQGMSIDAKGVVVSVKDSGIGIPEAQKSHIFEKMFRADNAMNQDENGTGLGLYIAKSLVERYGGKITFDSKENEGTTFYIFLPLTKNSRE